MRGRDDEKTLIEAMLLRGRSGTGGVILVEGQPGMGKSLLLAEAAKAAAAQGYTTVAAAADELGQMIPLCRRCLERLASDGPVLVTVDDLQYADPATLLALRVLPRQLAARPLSWILARSTEPASRPGPARLFDLLDHDGADRLPLRPLSDTAIAEVITDLLGAPPGSSLLALASGAGGNPLLVGELLRGLREENMLRTGAAGATTTSQRLPQRVQAVFRHRLGALQPQTRQLIEVSAILGRSFAVADVAELLGQPPAAVLPAISEALAAGILTPADEALTFRDGMTWQAVAQALPGSLSRALHLQAGRLFLNQGNAVQAAGHLVKGAGQGDGRILLELDMVLRRVLPRDARTAADLATRALELTSPDDPARAQRSVSAVQALLAARRLRDAASLIETSLTWSLPPVPRARLRCARVTALTLAGRPGQARAEAEELLAEPDLPAAVRDDVTVALLDALGELPDVGAAGQRARAAGRLAARLRGADRPAGAVAAAAKALQATVKWNQGHIAAGLDLFREAASEGNAEPGRGGRPYRPILSLAAHLIDVGLVDEASALLSAPCEAEDGASLAAAQAVPALLRARIHLAAGRIESAIAEAEAALGPDREPDGLPYTALARCMLGAIALRRGDLSSAGQFLHWATTPFADTPFADTPFADTPLADAPLADTPLGIGCQILAAQVADARDGPAAAMSLAGRVYDLVGEVRWPLIRDPGLAPWLVRLALAVGDRKLAARAVAVASELGRLNPAFPAVTASAAHAQGLLRNDVSALRLAARTQPDLWARASAGADLAAPLAATDGVTEAIEWLDHAYDNFLASGASRDAARVRGMLRRLGVRRRRWRAVRPPPGPVSPVSLPGPANPFSPPGPFGPGGPFGPFGPVSPVTPVSPVSPVTPVGLDLLSDAERGIAELVCQGLTNRQIAERTFVSANTVAFHLRNIYRKLRITSRVQLTTMMLSPRQGPNFR